jgi:hypothetical protein
MMRSLLVQKEQSARHLVQHTREQRIPATSNDPPAAYPCIERERGELEHEASIYCQPSRTIRRKSDDPNQVGMSYLRERRGLSTKIGEHPHPNPSHSHAFRVVGCTSHFAATTTVAESPTLLKLDCIPWDISCECGGPSGAGTLR